MVPSGSRTNAGAAQTSTARRRSAPRPRLHRDRDRRSAASTRAGIDQANVKAVEQQTPPGLAAACFDDGEPPQAVERIGPAAMSTATVRVRRAWRQPCARRTERPPDRENRGDAPAVRCRSRPWHAVPPPGRALRSAYATAPDAAVRRNGARRDGFAGAAPGTLPTPGVRLPSPRHQQRHAQDVAGWCRTCGRSTVRGRSSGRQGERPPPRRSRSARRSNRPA